ncbi:hypothetical protein [uncultured Arthrobacter sp.]|uniref:trypsin-like serine peptidase n=1 Tax=uncultured Arthrobacter sp. TaxID=114050 RepID=UPI0028D90074|nr:hypothetical protein [uncultured Arthrobacter sp.]
MTSKKTLAGSLLSLSTGLLLAVSAIGGATASSATTQDPSGLQVASTAIPSSTAASYWTPERMRAAVPGDVLAEQAVARYESKGRNSSPEITGNRSSKKISGTSGQRTTAALHKDERPVSHIGKVFFTLAGVNYVCSGNSVVADNSSTVATAGHCVNQGPGAFATNFVFVPGYNNGLAPYGKWPAKTLYAPSEWSSEGNLEFDTGFAVVASVGGEALADVVGASGVLFNEERGLSYKSFGYPVAAPFTGQTLVSCSGKASDDAINPQFNSQGISCDMTGGSSGGPWFIPGDGDTTELGYQNSVNSYGYGIRSVKMFGPYWGSVIENTYDTASSAN